MNQAESERVQIMLHSDLGELFPGWMAYWKLSIAGRTQDDATAIQLRERFSDSLILDVTAEDLYRSLRRDLDFLCRSHLPRWARRPNGRSDPISIEADSISSP